MFQLSLKFSLESNFLPISMEQLIVSFLKASAKEESQQFFDDLFDKNKSIIKTYTFSYYLPKAKFEKDRITLEESTFTMYFSDSNLNRLIYFYNAFLRMKFKKYPMNNNSMKLIHVSMNPLKEITDNEIIIKMQSPLLVREHTVEGNKDKYYLSYEEGFSKVLKKNTEYVIEKLNLNISTDGFSITPVKAKKVVVSVFGRKVDGNLGIFKVTGNVDLLNFLYLSGLGSRRGEGKGKFEIIA